MVRQGRATSEKLEVYRKLRDKGYRVEPIKAIGIEPIRDKLHRFRARKVIIAATGVVVSEKVED